MNISNTTKVLQGLLSAAVMALAGWSQAQTKINDVPMAVGNNVAPNFMFMIDNSYSMRAIVAEKNSGALNPYDASVVYTPTCPANRTVASTDVFRMKTSSLSNNAPRFLLLPSGVSDENRARGGSFNPPFLYRHRSLPASTATEADEERVCFATNVVYRGSLLKGEQAMDTEYLGNYLNWYFGNYGGHPLTGWGDRKPLNKVGGGTMLVAQRMEVVKASAKRAVMALPEVSASGDPKVRVGLSTYYVNGGPGNRGGLLVRGMLDLLGDTDFVDSTRIGKRTFNNAIDGLTPLQSTPLASTLADIGRYFATGSATATLPVPDATLPLGQALATKTVNLDGSGGLLQMGGTDQTDPSTRDACLWSNVNGNRSSCTAGGSARPIQRWCQRSYVFFLTDGLASGDRVFNNNALMRDYDGDCSGINAAKCVNSGAPGDWDKKIGQRYLTGSTGGGSDYLDDVAKALFEADLRPDLAKPALPNDPNLSAYDNWNRKYRNNVRLYPIGFADKTVQDEPLLTNAGRQGGGSYVSAADGDALDAELRLVIGDAFAKESTTAAVAVANTQLKADGSNLGYLSSYIPGVWGGRLKAFDIDPVTGEFKQPPLWDFADKLRQQVTANGWASRKIVSFDATKEAGKKGVAFTPANFAKVATVAARFSFKVGPPRAIPANQTDPRPDAPADLIEKVIDYIRGDESSEATTITVGAEKFTFRDRQQLLGDIINAEAVVIEEGTNKYLFQAANDGMLHVVNANRDGSGAGEALWSYVPSFVHANLHQLATAGYAHKYFVDATPAVVKLGGSGMRLLVGGLGAGGAGYYALNVSDPVATSVDDAASKVLWEFTDPDMGLTFGTPQIVKTAAGWRVVVASGLNNANGRGYVYILDPATGQLLNKIDTGEGTQANRAGLAHLSRMANSAPDATVRYLYGGDLLGNVWRIDLDNATAARIARLTGPDNNPQPVTAPVEVGPVVGTSTKFYVYVGTGKYLHDSDVPGSADVAPSATYRQSLYGIIDDVIKAPPSTPADIRGTNGTSCPAGGGNGDFVCQTVTPHPTLAREYRSSINVVDIGTKRGWYVDWPVDPNLSHARVFGQPALSRGGTLVVSVNVPTSQKCEPGGKSWVMSFWGQSGGAVPKSQGNTTSSQSQDYYDIASASQGDVLSSRARLMGTTDGKTKAVVSRSGSDTKTTDVPEPAVGAVKWRRIQSRTVK